MYPKTINITLKLVVTKGEELEWVGGKGEGDKEHKILNYNKLVTGLVVQHKENSH